MISHTFLFIVITVLNVLHSEAFLSPSIKTKTISSLMSSTRLYQDEPNPLDSSYIKREEHDTKHSTFHVQTGLDTIDDKSDPAHSIHHHLIDVDHNKLNDLQLRAQNAWTPTEVHEIEVDATTAATALFALLASILFFVGLSG
mmetsp:Transcript_18329/g.39589  ORF Transcript_18329/g.39589 Transcript_18329/m.39589 type:complete len:143 (-) Transcript_18329:2253-2681(-)